MAAKSYRAQRFGIMNHVGGIWGPETFDTAENAQAHLDTYRKDWATVDLSRHKVVPVRITVSLISEKANTRAIDSRGEA